LTGYSWQIAHLALNNNHTFIYNLAKISQYEEEFENTTEVIRIHKSKKDRQCNGER